MPQTIHLSNVSEFLKGHLVDVFETMLSIKALPSPKLDFPHFTERVTGSVGFAGDDVNGVVYLHLSGPFASRMAAAMLGMTLDQTVGDAEVNDVVGEVTNMLTGGLKSWLCDSGMPCAVSTPAIIRGTSFVVEAMPEVKREVRVFDCGDERVLVEIHIKID